MACCADCFFLTSTPRYMTRYAPCQTTLRYRAMLLKTWHRLAAFHDTIELSLCAKTNNNDNVHDLGSLRRDP